MQLCLHVDSLKLLGKYKRGEADYAFLVYSRTSAVSSGISKSASKGVSGAESCLLA